MAQVPNKICGPLLRYTFTRDAVWNGSLLLVLKADQKPSLRLSSGTATIQPVSLLADTETSFWRFPLSVPLQEKEGQVTYTITGGPLEVELTGSFWVPGKDDSMRIMFHSCNGYDITVKPGIFVGPSLWNDVMSIHEQAPFHVLIGGGDQVYSDAVRVDGPLKEWADITDPRKRAKMPANPQLEKEIEEWYFNNYVQWYSTDLIARAMAAIPSTNIWDDHDILDGYGSYPDRYQRAPIFLAIGRIAWKYYALFQHHTPPDGEKDEDLSFVLGPVKGPYISQFSRSVCSTMGPRTVYYGLDCRTDRTAKTICSPGTYDAMFARLDKEVVKGQTEHVLLLLGVPIFYPRLVWAEKLMSWSMLTAPLKKLNQKFGVMGSAFNQAEGGIELLDDLADHWCAGRHKRERNNLVGRLQLFSAEKQVRITILSGDVHLAAIGRVFSRNNTPQNKDARYMVNIISSAITNAPPPVALANLLDQRNRIHHFDAHTDENLMPIFFENPDGPNNLVNKTTMPSRNYCIITEHNGVAAEDAPALQTTTGHEKSNGTPVSIPFGEFTIDVTAAPSNLVENTKTEDGDEAKEAKAAGKRNELAEKLQSKDEAKQAEAEAQKSEKPTPAEDMHAARKQTGGVGHIPTKRKGALDISVRVEINPKDPLGRTRPYGFSIPALEL